MLGVSGIAGRWRLAQIEIRSDVQYHGPVDGLAAETTSRQKGVVADDVDCSRQAAGQLRDFTATTASRVKSFDASPPAT